MTFHIQEPINPQLEKWTPHHSWNITVPKDLTDKEKSIYNVYMNLYIFEEISTLSEDKLFCELTHWLQKIYDNSDESYRHWFKLAWTTQFNWEVCGGIYYRPSLLLLNKKWQKKHNLTINFDPIESTTFHDEKGVAFTANNEIDLNVDFSMHVL